MEFYVPKSGRKLQRKSSQQLQKEQIKDQILAKFKDNQRINPIFILQSCMDFPDIQKQPKFIEILFIKYLPITLEIFDIMLNPHQVVNKKKINNKFTMYPYQARQLFKQNTLVYQQIYYCVRTKKINFDYFFNFLRKQKISKETIFTSLGYFADVFLPFARHDFSTSESIKMCIKKNLNGFHDFSVLKLISNELITFLIDNCHFQPIFLFLTTICFINLNNEKHSNQSKFILLQIFTKVKIRGILEKFPIKSSILSEELQKNMLYLQNIYRLLRQYLQFIEHTSSSLNQYAFKIGMVLLDSDIVSYFTNQLVLSKKVSLNMKERRKYYFSVDIQLSHQQQHDLLNYSQQKRQQDGLHQSSISIGEQKIRDINKKRMHSVIELAKINNDDQQQFIEILLKIMTTIVKIYTFIEQPKDKQLINTVASSSLHMKYYVENNPTKPENLVQLKKIFKKQLKFLFDSLQYINRYVYSTGKIHENDQSFISFSSGENIKMVTLAKYNYFKLLYRCLILGKAKSQNQVKADNNGNNDNFFSEIDSKQQEIQLIIPFQKLHLMQIIKKYLSLNRWNNICHQILEKIYNICISKFYNYTKKCILENDKIRRVNNSFLAYLIENFTKKDYIFLHSFKFTSQGNLFILYKMSKELIYLFKNNKQVSLILSQFQPWTKFICQDLKKFQDKLYPKVTKPQQEQTERNTWNVKIDQADMIQRLIVDIAAQKKWAYRHQTKSKQLLRSFSLVPNTTQQYLQEEFIEKKKAVQQNFTTNYINRQLKPQGNNYLNKEQTSLKDSLSSKQSPTKVQWLNTLNFKRKLNISRLHSFSPANSQNLI